MTMNQVDPFASLAQRQKAPGTHVLDSIRQELKNDSQPQRMMSRRKRIFISACLLVGGLTLSVLAGPSHGLHALVLAASAFSLSAAALLLAGAVPGSRGSFRFPTRRYILATLLLATFSTLALFAENFSTFSAFTSGHQAHQAITCGGHALLTGVLGSSALMLLWRRTDPFSPGLTGAVLGFCGGAMGTLSVSLLCSNHEGLHLTISHGMGVLILVLLGIGAGRKWLTP